MPDRHAADDPARRTPGAGSRRTSAQRAGDRAEADVVARLAASGWTIVVRNVHVGRAEIDAIGIDPGPPRTIVVVEVRWRGRRDYGLAEETVDHRKRARLHAAAWAWLDGPEGRALDRLPVRFDLVVVEPAPGANATRIRHHRGAL